MRNPRLPSPGEIAVETNGGTVTLSGTVRSLGERDAAVAAVSSAPGISRVEDRIVVEY